MQSSGSAVSAPRLQRSLVARRHGFRVALDTSSQRPPAGPAAVRWPSRTRRSTSGLVRLHERAQVSGERSVQQQASCGARVRRTHRMAAKKQDVSGARRPSTLLRHGHAARCQHWPLVQSPQRAAAAAACESSGAGATWWTARSTAANMDGRPRGVDGGHSQYVQELLL